MNLLKTEAEKFNIDLTDYQMEQFETYFNELVLWNKRLNLTTITGYRDVQINHFLDSLTLIPHLSDIRLNSIVDIGSGAGFPGIPLKIALPHIDIALIESKHKKAEFLMNIRTKLGLDRLLVLQGRAEHFGKQLEYRERYDIAVSRAVGSLSLILEYMLPLCSIEGLCICYRTIPKADEIENSKNAADLLGAVFHAEVPAYYNNAADSRVFVIYRKVSPTPAKYPRTAGIPSKRPL